MKFVTEQMLKDSVENAVRSIRNGEDADLVEAICRSIYSGETEAGENIYDKYQHAELGTFVSDRLGTIYERAYHLPHYTKWKKPLKFLFTNVSGMDTNEYKTIKWKGGDGEQTFECMKFEIDPASQESYNRERTLDVYLKDIGNDFEGYYGNIYEAVKCAPQNLKYDLYYLLLYRLKKLENDTIKYPEEEIADIENWYGKDGEESKELGTYFKFREGETKRCMDYTKKLLSNDRFIVPMGYTPYIEEANEWNDREALVLENMDTGIQLAALYYPTFKNMYMKGTRENYSYEHMKTVIDNVRKFSQWCCNEEISLFQIERFAGINLCIQFAGYYKKILDNNSEEKKEKKRLLMEILKEASRLPNVLSRIAIIKEFLEPVVFFYNNSRRQLLNVRNRMAKYVTEYNKGLGVIADVVLEAISKETKSNKRLLDKYIKSISDSLCKEKTYIEENYKLMDEPPLNFEPEFPKIQKRLINYYIMK